jgi:hypothetical protein
MFLIIFVLFATKIYGENRIEYDEAGFIKLDLSNREIVNLTTNRMQTELQTIGINLNNKKKVSVLILNDNNLSSIGPRNFKNLENLKSLSIERNDIMEIEDGALAYLKNLNFLNFADNNITNISENLLSKLEKLEELNLSGNKNITIDESAFDSLKSLKVMQLNRNYFKMIQPAWFEKLNRLEELYLNKNGITEVSEKTFAGLVNLKWLEMEGNKIFYLDVVIFENNIHLEKLKFADNSLMIIKNIGKLKTTSQIDLTENICIDGKFEVSEDSTKKIEANCGGVDKLYDYLIFGISFAMGMIFMFIIFVIFIKCRNVVEDEFETQDEPYLVSPDHIQINNQANYARQTSTLSKFNSLTFGKRGKKVKKLPDRLKRPKSVEIVPESNYAVIKEKPKKIPTLQNESPAGLDVNDIFGNELDRFAIYATRLEVANQQ